MAILKNNGGAEKRRTKERSGPKKKCRLEKIGELETRETHTRVSLEKTLERELTSAPAGEFRPRS